MFRKSSINPVNSNSLISQHFVEVYDQFTREDILESRNSSLHQTFAPSSFRCNRISWFRLRGVHPDTDTHFDTTLEFIASEGTSIHKIIQSRLKLHLKDCWLSPKDHIENLSIDATCVDSEGGLETLIEYKSLPVRFSCDGLIRFSDQVYLLEIKTCEFNTWDSLLDIKDEHIDQIKFYCFLLQLDHVLVMYVDRLYGGVKCFEFKMTEEDVEYIRDKIAYVQSCVDTNIAPNPLSVGDKWCSPNYCKYYYECSRYGRYL